MGATPSGKRGRSRWDETPAGVGMAGGATPMMGQTPMMGMTPAVTPMGGMDMPTPSPSSLPKVPLTAEQYQVRRSDLWSVRAVLEPVTAQVRTFALRGPGLKQLGNALERS